MWAGSNVYAGDMQELDWVVAALLGKLDDLGITRKPWSRQSYTLTPTVEAIRSIRGLVAGVTPWARPPGCGRAA